MDPARIFDRAALRLHRDRARGDDDFVARYVAAELIERLAPVRRGFAEVLCLGDPGGVLARYFHGSGARLALADPDFADDPATAGLLPGGSFDLVLSASGLDRINDLPGTLFLIRRALKPDGLFLGGLVGAGSLPRLRAAMLAADLAAGGAAPRIHPQIDVRAAGDLLARAGFVLPVADGDEIAVRYSGLAALVSDIRAAGAGNALLARSRMPLTRKAYDIAVAAFTSAADADGRTAETLALVYLSGWAPPP